MTHTQDGIAWPGLSEPGKPDFIVPRVSLSLKIN